MYRRNRCQAPKVCVICGDQAIGQNFNALTCMSCKAFFRRNARSEKKFRCPFTDNCQLSKVTRKFCAKCRMQKCLNVGMKKEWILSEQERAEMKERVAQNRQLKQQKVLEQLKMLQHNLSVDSGNNSFSSSTPTSPEIQNLPHSFDHQVNNHVSVIVDNDRMRNHSFNQDSTKSSIISPLNHSSEQNHSQTHQTSPKIDMIKVIEEPSAFTIDALIQQTENCVPTHFPTTEPTTPQSFDLSHDYETIDQDVSNATYSYKYSPNQSENDFISHYLVNNPPADPLWSYDPSIDFVPFASRELIEPERRLLKELTSACAVLHNPYPKFEDQKDRFGRMNQYIFHRLIRMAKQLASFNGLTIRDQTVMLKRSLVEMLCIRSVLMYIPERNSWRLVDDKGKASVMIRMELIKPFCSPNNYERHQKLPRLFREEWKRDNIIFDLLTVIVLFSPRPGYCETEKIQEEHAKYTYLLRRYLEVKYSSLEEAMASFNQLLRNVDEMRSINEDIFQFLRSYAEKIGDSPLYVQLLDLQRNTPTRDEEAEQIAMNHMTSKSNGSSSHEIVDILKYI